MICRACHQDKPETDFSWKTKAKGLRQTICKPCAAAYERSYRAENPHKVRDNNQRYYDATREAQLAQKRLYYERNREKLLEKSKQHRLRLRESGEDKRNRRGYDLKSKFGLSVADYNRMVKEQDGLCKICRQPSSRLVVDHCHETGRVRGLLCAPCNSFLGRINDSPEALLKVIEYLRQ